MHGMKAIENHARSLLARTLSPVGSIGPLLSEDPKAGVEMRIVSEGELIAVGTYMEGELKIQVGEELPKAPAPKKAAKSTGE